MERFFTGLLFLAFFSTGCGGDARSYSVEGDISLDGTMVGDGNDAVVRFESVGEGGGASADAFIKEGKYQVKLLPGKYKVAIRWNKKTGKKTVSKIAGPGAESEEIKEAIPKEFNSESKLSAEVNSEKLRHDFTLKSQ